MADKFSVLAAIGLDWWWEMDAELRFTAVSDRFEEVFGRPASAVIGKKRTDLERTDYSNAAWHAHLDDLANRRPFRDFETTFVDSKGVTRPVMISGAPLFDPDGTFKGYVGAGHDLTALRRQERKAAEHAAHVDLILENIDQGVVLLDKDLRVAVYNRRLADWLGVNEDVRGQTFEQMLRQLADRGEYAPDNAETAIATRLQLVKSGEPFVGERKRTDGRIFSVAFNPLPSGGGIMTYSDVTEVRAREARLARSEEGFRVLFTHSPLPKFVYKADTLQIREVNQAAIDLYGYSRDEFLSLTLRDIRPPEDIPRLLAWMARPAAERRGGGIFRHQCKDGRLIDVEVVHRDIEFGGERARLSMVLDVTARRVAERAKQRVFETSQDIILVTDSYGKCLQVSPSSEKIIGLKPEDMVGRNAAEFIFPPDLETTRNEMRVAHRGDHGRSFQCRYLHKDGHIVPLVWMDVWSEVDRQHFFIGRDMTDYDRTQEQLRQAQKMESVGQLTGGVAHDFNNILMIILANVEALQEDTALDPAARERIDGIGDAAGRAADLTRQLLAFSRKQVLRPQLTNINGIVAKTEKLLRRTLSEQIEIDTRLAADVWELEIDRAQLEAALVNLALNARDAMRDGGRLSIETRNAALDCHDVAQNPEVVPGDYVMIAVTDGGTGMSPEVLKRAFDPFFTTKDVGKGTGLGLSMVYGFIKQSKGHIEVQTEVGRGTSIRLFLPRSASQPASKARFLPSAMPHGTERILVVDDDMTVCAGVASQLRSLGYSVSEASDGKAGVTAFEEATRPFDLLLTDVIMPGPMNGKALADAVISQWPATKIVFMSGYTEDAIAQNGRLEEGVFLLSKPFRKSDLAVILRQALDATGRPTA